ncbi:hypothetical protein SynA15127_01462 [Synechococcus sp. A15-127]|nr:hypothetical protein SynA15127_01462 [Synechococcus sp. A15-127]
MLFGKFHLKISRPSTLIPSNQHCGNVWPIKNSGVINSHDTSIQNLQKSNAHHLAHISPIRGDQLQ